MHQSDAENIVAQEVELQQSAAANVKAEHFSAHQSAVAMLNAKDVSVEESAVGFVQAEKMSAGGYTGVIVAGSADVQHGMAVFVAGREVHVNEARTGILLARNVSGNVTTLLNTREALLVGLVGGLFAGLMLMLGRVLFGRK
jgi:alanine dehydrogenase